MADDQPYARDPGTKALLGIHPAEKDATPHPFWRPSWTVALVAILAFPGSFAVPAALIGGLLAKRKKARG